MKNNRLWYDAPADSGVFESGLPIGNGQLGAMVYAGVDSILFQLNHESVWYGGPRERVNPAARELLPRVRELLFDGQLKQAEELASMGLFAAPSSPGCYQPLANFRISFSGSAGQHQHCSRSLDLLTAMHHCRYQLAAGEFSCESFISYPAKVMAVFLKARGGGALDLLFELERGSHCERIYTPGPQRLCLEGSGGGAGPRFASMVQLEAEGGSLESFASCLRLRDARSLVLYVSGATDFEGCEPLSYCLAALDSACSAGYQAIREAHLEDYQALYRGCELDISQGQDFEELPTDRRLERVWAGERDAGLCNLYFNFGRYLLIACSRPGSLPANLQGLWNRDMDPPWGSKYTININTQMNYWPALVTGLAECQRPLLDHLKRMFESGSQVAREMYGCRGFVAHHNTDIYGDCAPVDHYMPATLWPMGAAWLLLHWLEHYAYEQDLEQLKEGYPLIKAAALFFVDFLVEDAAGRLVTAPSVSPENTYILPNGQMSTLCYGPSMDSQIIYELWSGFLEASRLLGESNQVTVDVEQRLDRLPQTRLGSRGQILEWLEEYEEKEPGHRHISHLFALHPGKAITFDASPQLFAGARISLEERLSHGGGHTGWSRAWIINMWARLFDGDLAHEHFYQLLRHSTAFNLFDMHPPFQIDGNFGAVAGICEMLLQSHEGFVRVLPALPAAWPAGSLKGLRARGGIVVDISWSDGSLDLARFTALCATRLDARYRETRLCTKLAAGQSVTMPGPGL